MKLLWPDDSRKIFLLPVSVQGLSDTQDGYKAFVARPECATHRDAW
jgi:hypothetical protein